MKWPSIPPLRRTDPEELLVVAADRGLELIERTIANDIRIKNPVGRSQIRILLNRIALASHRGEVEGKIGAGQE